MRLLHSESQVLREFTGDDNIPSYAILSHTWGEDEVTYQDMASSSERQKLGYSKIQYCCDQAIQDNIEWIWVDTCCIDKSSSAELSEAINSMFRWYQDAFICYVYLSDVSDIVDLENVYGEFTKSRWFTRGWALQELLAPSNVIFYSNNWSFLGTKESFSDLLWQITGIEPKILQGCDFQDLEKVSVAMRMSWASKRKTTRVEDIAYSLLGIFDVNMPLMYGEGRRAFLRLQEEILKSSNDHSIFAWGTLLVTPTMEASIQDEYVHQNRQAARASSRPNAPLPLRPAVRGLLADSPAEFAKSNNIVAIQGWVGNHGHPPMVHNRCVRINVPMLTDVRTGLSFAVLGCCIRDARYNFEHFLAVSLKAWRNEVYFGRLELVLVSGHNNQLSDDNLVRSKMRTIQVKQRGWVALANL